MITGRQSRVLGTAGVALLLLTLFAAATYASAEGRRNTAIGLSALAGVLATGREPAPAVVAGAGALYAWQRYAEAPRYGYYYGRPYHGYRSYGYYPRGYGHYYPYGRHPRHRR